MIRIIQFTTVHPRTDVRIVVKEVTTLSQCLDAEVDLFVQDGLGDARDATDGFNIIDTGPRPKGRIKRMTGGAWRMYRAVRAAKPMVAHFHDPELIPVGLLLRLSGIKVIYDVHEDLPRQIASKAYIRPALRGVLSKVASAIEWIAGNSFNGIVAAVPSIAARFPHEKTILLRNFPLPEDVVAPDARPYAERSNFFTYIGGLTEVRGTREMVSATHLTASASARLQLAGSFQQQEYQDLVSATDGWDRVDFHGWVGREQIADILGNSRAGMVTLYPTPAHVDSLPVKFFEYMAAGLPVISSDFPMLRDIIERHECGLIVDPMDPIAIAEAMDRILSNPETAEAMGRSGQRAIASTYNWPTEGEKLMRFYHERLGVPLKAKC